MKNEIYTNKNDSLVSLKVYEPKKYKTRFIAETKEWHDRLNGNTYFSTRIEIIEHDVMYVIPFQNGYGDHSEYEVKRLLKKAGYKFDNQEIKFIKHDALKRDAERHGEGNEDSLFYYDDNTYAYYLD